MCRSSLKNTGRKKSPKNRHLGTIAQFVGLKLHKSQTGGNGITETCTTMRKGMELNKNIGSKSFVQRLLVQSVRQQVAKPQVLMTSQQNCSKQERQHWIEYAAYVWWSRKLMSGQRKRTFSIFIPLPKKGDLKQCEKLKTTEHCCCGFQCKKDSSSDHTEKDPSEDRNRNCRRTGRIPTR